MPIYQRLIDLNQKYLNANNNPIIINDLPCRTKEERDYIRNLVQTRYDSDTISTLPSCRCGNLNKAYYLGTTCPECHTEVIERDEDNDIFVWYRRPEQIHRLINPQFWLMLSFFLMKKKFDVLYWLTNTRYRPKADQQLPDVCGQILDLGINRGYNYFVQNIHTILPKIFSLPYYKAATKSLQVTMFLRMLEDYSNEVFTDYIPIPNKMMLVLEASHTGLYVTSFIVKALDAIYTAVNSEQEIKMGHKVSTKILENRVASFQAKLADFYKDYYMTMWVGKGKLFRGHIYGSKTHFSFRTVITSLTDEHLYDTIYVPWGVALATFRPYVLNKLKKRGYGLVESTRFIYKHINKYHPLLHEILEEMIQETPNQEGFICTFQRNPSLLRGSGQLLKVKFKYDPTDNTTSMSDLIAKAYNADHDGDELNAQLIHDRKLQELFYPLSPHYNVVALDKPRKLSGNMALTKPMVANLAEWLHTPTKPEEITQDKLDRFNQIPTIDDE